MKCLLICEKNMKIQICPYEPAEFADILSRNEETKDGRRG